MRRRLSASIYSDVEHRAHCRSYLLFDSPRSYKASWSQPQDVMRMSSASPTRAARENHRRNHESPTSHSVPRRCRAAARVGFLPPRCVSPMPPALSLSPRGLKRNLDSRGYTNIPPPGVPFLYSIRMPRDRSSPPP